MPLWPLPAATRQLEGWFPTALSAVVTRTSSSDATLDALLTLLFMHGGNWCSVILRDIGQNWSGVRSGEERLFWQVNSTPGLSSW